jgi:hypothetical protein
MARATKLLQEGEFVSGPQGGGTVKQADGSFKSVSEEARAILMGERPSKDAYEIRLEGGSQMKAQGKLNLLEGTIDGKKIDTDYQQRGAFDRSGTKSRNSEDASDAFISGRKQADIEQGFVFALDEANKLWAIPHTWDRNDPAGTVGIFRGDKIINVGGPKTEGFMDKTLNLRVIGTFDSSPRGLQMAAAIAGDEIGRKNGIKQTAEILNGSKWQTEMVTSGFKPNNLTMTSIAKDISRGTKNSGNKVRKLNEAGTGYAD